MDHVSYRAAEALGRQAVRSIRNAAVHYPEAFDHVKFPMRITNHEDLASYLDVMHEGRFPAFMAELDGFDGAELDEFVAGLARYCRFFMAHFRSSRVPLPLSGMLSQYCLYRKIRGIPDARTVLEIGPGSGLHAFFLAADPGIERYDHVEVTEAFYLLQTLIGRYLHGHRFVDHAQLDAFASGLGDVGMAQATAVRPRIFDQSETTYELAVERAPRSEHFPWWKLASLFERRYDVVTSNANLTEFSLPALRYYSALTRAVLKPTGLFLAQCLGGGAIEPQQAMKTFIEAGFVPLVMAAGYPLAETGPDGAAKARRLAVLNLVLLPPGHPLLATLRFDNKTGALIDTADPLTRSIFSMDRAPADRPAPERLVELVAARLQAMRDAEATAPY